MRSAFIWLGCRGMPYTTVVLFLLMSVFTKTTHAGQPVEHMSVKPSTKHQFCSFFANRAPNIQLGLKNCTWFKESSCCRQKEIDALFPRVKPLRGASPACQKYTNYLMCYVCAPNQGDFYKKESLTVCEEFCDSWYDACQFAVLKGSVIKDLYSNGSEYCHSRRFKVQPKKKGGCFFFDAKQDTSRGFYSSSDLTTIVSSAILVILAFIETDFTLIKLPLIK
ncbi:hypothetical protein EGW08_011717 [Elysia chlorotica]|uniref:Folate receptor-like domain-containing protein n=1 Tax=Elysia chlorotica TaxID=188477 RepID=A0A433TG37_ELYCH|nr:hypothetical protein EGW08_011717 [Elysia chlorotica]